MTSSPPGPGSYRARDTGRAAVYAGENQVARLLDRAAEFPVVEVAGSRITLPPERHFGDVAGVQRYVDEVLALNWVAERWPARAAVPVVVRARRGVSQAHYEFASATMAVPVRGMGARWALREMVVLHELAHHLASDAGGRQGRRDGSVSEAGGRQGRRDEVAGPPSAAPSEQSNAAGPPSAAPSEQSDTGDAGNTDSAADAVHGPGFRGRMLALVGGVMGDEIAFLLRVAWADQGAAIG